MFESVDRAASNMQPAILASLLVVATLSSCNAQSEFNPRYTTTYTEGLAPTGANGEFLRVCYYTNWSQYRPNAGQFYPENVDPRLCSHLIFAFATMEGNRLAPYEWNDETTDWAVGM